jgi:RimJ/RimL family protein N-acetyltransferase
MRRLNDGDEALYCSLYTDAGTMRFICEPLTPERAARGFRNSLATSGSMFFTILEKATQYPVGICAAMQLDTSATRAEVGIMLKSDACSKGYAREGLGGLVRQAFLLFPVEKIWVQCSALNPLVERMVCAVGFALDDPVAKETGSLLQRIWSIHRSSWPSADTTNQWGNE